MSDRTPSDAKDFAIEDYKGWLESLNRSEEIGEKRLEFFVTFSTAVLGALLALAKLENDSINRIEAVALARWVLPMLLVLGLLTFLRMLRRDSQTDLCKAQLNRARAWFEQDENHRRSQYWPPWLVVENHDRKERLVVHGGLSTIMLAVNAMLVGLWLGVLHSNDSVDPTWFFLGNGYGWASGMGIKLFSEYKGLISKWLERKQKSNQR